MGTNKSPSDQNALGRSTSYTYTARGQLDTVVDATGTTAERYTYASNGPVASFTDARGNVTQYARDGFDRLQSTTYAYGTGLASSESFGYDANNNLISRQTRAGQDIRFAYDTLNRLHRRHLRLSDGLAQLRSHGTAGGGAGQQRLDCQRLRHRELRHHRQRVDARAQLFRIRAVPSPDFQGSQRVSDELDS